MQSYRSLFLYSCNILFLWFAVRQTANGAEMLADTDPFWHIAAGDLIRQLHAIPLHDTWSFTAGDYRWLNISWLWDSIFSAIREHLGWHGVMAVNAIIIALTLTAIYINCIWHRAHFIASIITLFGATTLLPSNLRPLQITYLMVAVWIMLLGSIARGKIKSAWLALLPVSMLLWVNMHGGFVLGPILLGAFFLQACYDKNKPLAWHIFNDGIATLIAVMCNPYGIDIIEAVRRPMTTAANEFINEWQPITTSPQGLLTSLYMIAFCILVPWRTLPVLRAERWLAYALFFIGLTSRRHLPMFAILSAPALACAINYWLDRFIPERFRTQLRYPLADHYNYPRSAIMSSILAVAVALWLPTPMAAKAYGHDPMPLANLDPEINFIKTHYPNARLLTHFDLAGMLAYQTRGTIPVFVDPRTETAIPPEVFKDYICFQKACEGWESMMDRYHMDGVMIPAVEAASGLQDRFNSRKGWKLAFKGPLGIIYMRTQTKP